MQRCVHLARHSALPQAVQALLTRSSAGRTRLGPRPELLPDTGQVQRGRAAGHAPQLPAEVLDRAPRGRRRRQRRVGRRRRRGRAGPAGWRAAARRALRQRRLLARALQRPAGHGNPTPAMPVTARAPPVRSWGPTPHRAASAARQRAGSAAPMSGARERAWVGTHVAGAWWQRAAVSAAPIV